MSHISLPHYKCHNTHMLYDTLKDIEANPDSMARKASLLADGARASVASYRDFIVDYEMRRLQDETGGVITRKREVFFSEGEDGSAVIVTINRTGGKSVEQRHAEMLNHAQEAEAERLESEAIFMAAVDAFEQQPDPGTFEAVVSAHRGYTACTEQEAWFASSMINKECQLYFEAEEKGIDVNTIPWVYASALLESQDDAAER